MQTSKIEWTDRTWNPVTGCTKVSQGCKNCYAERLYERFNGHGSFKNVLTHPERLQQPRKWKQPSKIFVNSMSDLFHEDVPDQFIADVFDIMCSTPWHTYQVLTKRPERMMQMMVDCKYVYANNIWLGVSVEDQATANERIPLLLKVPAAVRFLSCEPLLGRIDIDECQFWKGKMSDDGLSKTFTHQLHWVICGGESGPNARPMHPDWARSLRDQCEAAGVPFFFKQWGEYGAGSSVAGKNILVANTGKMSTYSELAALVKSTEEQKNYHSYKMTSMSKIGKKAAGNLLDGRTHLEFPTINH